MKETPAVTDYQNDKAAEKLAHKYRWLVWGFVPAVVALYLILPPIIEAIGGILWWSFGK